MAYNAGDIFANLTLNTNQFIKEFKDVSSRIKSVGAQMQKAFGSNTNNAITSTGKAAKQAASEFKNFESVVSGILMAQAFYRITNAVQNGIRAVIEFSGNMQKAAIAMEYFLGSNDRASAFLSVMKDFAAVTPFSTEQAISMSQKLMAMGFAAENVKSVLGIMTDAASATGGTAEQMDRVVLALGQMKTNGYIAGQELRQLAETGIPVYRILQEELGLTADQIKDIGKMKISGDLGVAAILSGLEKRYKGAAAKIAETVPGMWSTIKDDFLLISDQMFKSSYGALDGFVRNIRDALEDARATVSSSGVGGLFEEMFSPGVQLAIRRIVGSFRSLKESFVQVVATLKPATRLISGVLIEVVATLVVRIAAVVRIMTNLVTAVLNAVPALNVLIATIIGLIVAQVAARALMFLWQVTQLGTICTVVAKAVSSLAIAIKGLFIAMVKNPLVAITMLIAGALLYLALSSKAVSGWINKAMASFTALAGFNTADILQPIDAANVSTDEFNARLKDMQNNLKEVGDAGKKTGKAIKDGFVSSFDEVYNVPDALGNVTDAELNIEAQVPSFSGTEGGASFPALSLPDTDAIIGSLSGLFENVKNKIVEIFTVTIPTALSGFFNSTLPTFLFETLPNAFSKALKYIGDLILNSPIGPIVQTVFGKLKDWWSEWGDDVKGVFVNGWEAIKVLGEALFTGLSAAFSVIFTALKNFWLTWGEDIKEIFRSIFEIAAAIVTPIVQAIKDFVVSTFDTLKQFFTDWGPSIAAIFTYAWERIKIIFSTTLDIMSNLIGSTFRLINNLLQFFINIFKGDWSAGWENIKTILVTIWNAIVNIFTKVFEAIVALTQAKFTAIKTIVSNTWENIKKELIKAWDEIVLSITNTITKIQNKFISLGSKITSTLSDTWTAVTSTIHVKWEAITEKFEDIVAGITSIFTDFKTTILSIWDGISSGIKSTVNGIIKFVNKMIDSLNAISVDIPTWVPEFGGKSFGFSIPNIPELATGGIVNKDSIIRAGEKNKREAVVPLDNSSYMRPFSQAVAEDLYELFGNVMNIGASNSNDRTPVYVGTLIADERSLKELERKLEIIRISENTRRGN